jgi:hypothetical protein
MNALPTKSSLSPAFAISMLAGALAAGAAAWGLFAAGRLYLTAAQRQSFLPNDVVTLALVLPALLVSMLLAWRGSWPALLCWPGALLYLTYNAIAYSAVFWASPFGFLNLGVGLLSVLAVILTLRGFNLAGLGLYLAGNFPEKLTGGVLLAFGLLFFVMRAGLLAQALQDPPVGITPELATALADVLIMPVWIAGGWAMLRRQAAGLAAGGLLFQASLLFLGLLLLFLLQPLFSGVPVSWVDFGVIAALGALAGTAAVLYLRGAGRAQRDAA